MQCTWSLYPSIVFDNCFKHGGKTGGSCTAALFLKAFVNGIEHKDGAEPPVRWAHLDIAGTMEVRACFTTPSNQTDASKRSIPGLCLIKRKA